MFGFVRQGKRSGPEAGNKGNAHTDVRAERAFLYQRKFFNSAGDPPW
jgi:hypothetical protein